MHSADRHLLGMEWRESVYIDNCLTVCAKTIQSACRSVVMDSRVKRRILFNDDFLTIGPATSSICQQNFDIFKSTCCELGVSLALEPLLSWGHTQYGNLQKLTRIQRERSATKRLILSLIGLLQRLWCCSKG